MPPLGGSSMIKEDTKVFKMNCKALNLIHLVLLTSIIFGCQKRLISNDNYPAKVINKADKDFKLLVSKQFNINPDTTIEYKNLSIKIQNSKLRQGKKENKKKQESITILYGSKGNIWKVYYKKNDQIDTFYHPNGIINEPW